MIPMKSLLFWSRSNNDHASTGSTTTMASDTPTHYEMTTSEQKLPADKFPEGGYGWVCVICTFFVNAHTWGVNSVCENGK